MYLWFFRGQLLFSFVIQAPSISSGFISGFDSKQDNCLGLLKVVVSSLNEVLQINKIFKWDDDWRIV